MATNPDLDKLKLPELKQMAEVLGIETVSSMRKPDLISAIKSLASEENPTSTLSKNESTSSNGSSTKNSDLDPKETRFKKSKNPLRNQPSPTQ